VAKDKEGLIGGVFRSQRDALRFALFEVADRLRIIMSSIMRRRRGLISAIGNSCLVRWVVQPQPLRQDVSTSAALYCGRFRSIGEQILR
jgi:hypothetical protein